MKTIGDDTAFPIPGLSNPNGNITNPYYGLTKREYFAAMIFSGIAANNNNWPADIKVKFAVDGADALIVELNK